jgi:3-deoxy-D-manno-octulosonic-acid transferase
MTFALYRALTTAGLPLIRLALARRRSLGREDAARMAERMGVASRARPEGALVWIHAASVGESLSVLALVERLARERPHVAALVTTGTVTSARLLERRLPPAAIHQYVPVDRAAWVARFLDHWRPDLVLWVESELWPNLLHGIAGRAVPAVLVNARVSPRSFARWRRFKGMARRLLATFDLCLAQSEANAASLRALGAANVAAPGNLKFASEPLPADPASLTRLEAAASGRIVWLAASTHEGEEEAIEAAHRVIAQRHDGLLTVIAPRHPARGRAIAAMLAARGHRAALRSTGALPGADDAFYVADTLGELGLFYRLAPVAFVGGSLVPHGGQNLLEPARLGAAVLHGPHVENFREIAQALDEACGAATVADPTSLAAAVDALLADPGLRARSTAAAARIAEAQGKVLEDVMAALAPYLDAACGAPDRPGDGARAPRHARA